MNSDKKRSRPVRRPSRIERLFCADPTRRRLSEAKWSIMLTTVSIYSANGAVVHFGHAISCGCYRIWPYSPGCSAIRRKPAPGTRHAETAGPLSLSELIGHNGVTVKE